MSKSRIQFINLLSNGITAILFIAVFAGVAFMFTDGFNDKEHLISSKIDTIEAKKHPVKDLCGCYTEKYDGLKTRKVLVYTDTIRYAYKNYRCVKLDGEGDDIFTWQGGACLLSKIECYIERYNDNQIRFCNAYSVVSKKKIDELKELSKKKRLGLKSCLTTGELDTQRISKLPQYLENKKLTGFICMLIIFVVISKGIQKL